MMYPAFFSFFAALWAFHRARIWQERHRSRATGFDPLVAAHSTAVAGGTNE
jgi:hypothetical protein